MNKLFYKYDYWFMQGVFLESSFRSTNFNVFLSLSRLDWSLSFLFYVLSVVWRLSSSLLLLRWLNGWQSMFWSAILGLSSVLMRIIFDHDRMGHLWVFQNAFYIVLFIFFVGCFCLFLCYTRRICNLSWKAMDTQSGCEADHCKLLISPAAL